MNQLPAFRQLQNFIEEQTARKPRKKVMPKPGTANELTRRIVDYIRANGHIAAQIRSNGTYHAHLQKFIGSQQRVGLPDVLAVVAGRAVFIEVEAGKDRLSNVQKQTIAAIQNSGAYVHVARTFQGFHDWFETYVLASPKLPTSLYRQRHPISYLATPDLPKSTFIP